MFPALYSSGGSCWSYSKVMLIAAFRKRATKINVGVHFHAGGKNTSQPHTGWREAPYKELCVRECGWVYPKSSPFSWAPFLAGFAGVNRTSCGASTFASAWPNKTSVSTQGTRCEAIWSEWEPERGWAMVLCGKLGAVFTHFSSSPLRTWGRAHGSRTLQCV